MADLKGQQAATESKDTKSVTVAPVLYDREGVPVYEGDEILVDIPYIDQESGPDIDTKRLLLLKIYGRYMATDGQNWNMPIRDLFGEAAAALGCCTFYGYAPAHRCGKKLHEPHDSECVYFDKKYKRKTLLQMSKMLGEEMFIESAE